MKKQEMYTPKFKKLVLDYMAETRYVLGIQEFEIATSYSEEEREDDAESSYSTLADISVDPKYLHAKMMLYPILFKRWQKHGNEYLYKALAHEACHILTQQMYDLATSVYKDEGEVKLAWEQLTERISKLLYMLEKKIAKRK